MPVEVGGVVADVQLEADLRGMHSHGLRAVPMYVERIRRGIVNPRPQPRVEETARAAVVVDGDRGPGQLVARLAMSEAIERAKRHGFGLAVARNSNHLGAVGYYANMAVEHDLIGFATTNGNVMLSAAPGGAPVVGNNPLAWAFPADEEPPLCFDVATSVVAGGKIDLAAAEGDSIPPGWGIDAHGVATTDAKLAAAGGLAIPLGAPAAPHKGLGLALVMEALGGVLAGAKFGRQHTVEVEQGVMPWDEGHFLLAFDPGMVVPVGQFKSRMDALIRDVRSSAPGARIPGQAAHERKQRALAEGLRLPASVYRRLADAADKAGTPTRLPA
jgi:ureidoglycolate dehydrogenase (NAD+)